MENQTPEPITTDSPQTADSKTQTPVKSFKFPVIPVLLVILVLLLGLTGYLYYQNQQLKKMLANYQTPPPTSIPTATADPTINWKTYRNTSANYEVKYPKDWKIENQAAGSFGNEPPVNSTFIEIYKPQGDPTKSLGNIGFEELGMIPPGEEKLLTITKNINNQQLRCYGDENANGKMWCFVKVPSLSKYLNIHIFRNVDKEINNTFDQILSTFKFLGVDDEINQTNKTYSGLGVTFSYPSTISLAQSPLGQNQQSFSGNGVDVLLTISPRKKNLDGSYLSLDKEFESVSFTHILVAGQDGIVVENKANTPNAYNKYFSTINRDGASIITLNVFVQPADFSNILKGANIYNQILSTFKFVN